MPPELGSYYSFDLSIHVINVEFSGVISKMPGHTRGRPHEDRVKICRCGKFCNKALQGRSRRRHYDRADPEEARSSDSDVGDQEEEFESDSAMEEGSEREADEEDHSMSSGESPVPMQLDTSPPESPQPDLEYEEEESDADSDGSDGFNKLELPEDELAEYVGWQYFDEELDADRPYTREMRIKGSGGNVVPR
ncbi:hypothetical protein R3P38DRAFT_2756409 [Favolaschia claudopus]|uniref:Uncharacterized protein n=1 Tax=Favolaschia claudopus TaxID=2862362 RepID=A0AAW0ECW6_9AGAR